MEDTLYTLKNGCHLLKYISFVGENQQQEYTAVFRNVRITLQCGFNFGMLSVDLKCDCCEGLSSKSYFFALKSSDRIIAAMQPTMESNGVELYLPSGDRGTFQLESYEEGFCDDYILRNLVLSEYQEGSRWFYEDTQVSIKLRSAFIMIKNWAHRNRMQSHRNTVLCSLTRCDIHEIGIRAKIVKFAHLW